MDTEGAALSDWAGHVRSSREYRRMTIALLLAGIATFAQLYSPQGVLPLIARDLRVDAATAALTVSAATLGLAIGVLPWSRAADRFGRLPVMRVSLAAATIAGLLTPAMPGVDAVLAMRFVEGIALAGVPATAITYLTEEVHASVTAVAAGTYVSGTTLGGLFGRIIAAPLAELAGWRIGVLTVAVLSAGAATGFAMLAPAARGFTRPAGDPPVARTVMRHLRTPALLMLFAQAFLLMGGFVAVYNYLSFRLEAQPFGLSPAATAALFLAYLAGTVSSRLAGAAAVRFGRGPVLVVAVATMAAGVLLTLPDLLGSVIAGLVVLTGGFFAAHAVASGWVGVRAGQGRAQASSVYNLAYYSGSSLVGWVGGFAFADAGWPGLAALVGGLAVIAGVWAAIDLKNGRRP